MNIQDLTISERILLAEQLWDSVVDEQINIEISEAQKIELDKRLTAYKADENPGECWSDIKLKYVK